MAKALAAQAAFFFFPLAALMRICPKTMRPTPEAQRSPIEARCALFQVEPTPQEIPLERTAGGWEGLFGNPVKLNARGFSPGSRLIAGGGQSQSNVVEVGFPRTSDALGKRRKAQIESLVGNRHALIAA